MTRLEFIEACKTLSEEELHNIARKSREMAEKRLPQETLDRFRTLDSITSVEEIYVKTAFGNTHVFLVRENAQPEG